ncbi:MAG TPA: hypothetical protein VGU27_10360, partial [Candidatus Eisenbacteria bacterium]|nr:hypothetical protein [Candidatus Eisenbacteria bacterium]
MRHVLRAGIAAALIALLACAAAPRARAGEQLDPACGTMVVVPSRDAAVVRLAHGFLRAGSDSVWSRAGAWARGRDYLLDRLRGDLRLLRPLPPGDTLWVAACWLLAPPPL